MTYQVPSLRFTSIINILFFSSSLFSPLFYFKKIRVQLSLEVCFSAFPLPFPGQRCPLHGVIPGKTPAQDPR